MLVFDRLAKNAKTAGIPVVVITASTDPKVEADSTARGARAVLSVGTGAPAGTCPPAGAAVRRSAAVSGAAGSPFRFQVNRRRPAVLSSSHRRQTLPALSLMVSTSFASAGRASFTW